MKLKQQLLLGFGLTLILLLAISLLSYYRFSTTGDGFKSYRDQAVTSVAIGRVQANILDAQLASHKFIKSQDPTLKQQVDERISSALELLDEALHLNLPQDQQQILQTIKMQVSDYRGDFANVVSLIDRRNNTVNTQLDPNGLAMLKSISNIVDTAADNQNMDVLINAGKVQEHILLARLYAVKYLVTNLKDDAEQAIQELANIQQQSQQLKSELDGNAQLSAQYQTFTDAFMQYQQAFTEIRQTIEKRNELIRTRLDTAGTKTAQSIEQVKLDVKEVQDELGPQMVDNIDSTQWMLLVLSVIAVSCALSIAFLIYRGILKVVGGEPAEIAAIVQSIAKGNLSSRHQMTGNESGIYLSTLQMREELQRIIGSFHQISDSVSAAAEQLSAVVEQSEKNAQQELHQIEQIATAITELSSTANEVSMNANNAEDAANQANGNVSESKDALAASDKIANSIAGSITETTQIVNQLHGYSIEIGSVVEVINNISEQTNLLALNAAIEAARAGEQGRGFAVVADEVRSLAVKTQKSTLDIQEIIGRLQKQAEHANDFMQSNISLVDDSRDISRRLHAAFEAISHSVATISDMNTHVATASEEQSGVTKDISSNISHAFTLVHQNVSGIAESKQSSERLSELVEEQKSLLRFFKY
ncbi:MCP four helix bundle domain-containing protein [Vibrio mimicus]